MEIKFFLEVEDPRQISKAKNGLLQYHNNGQICYTVGSVIPVIHLKNGCIGLAHVKRVIIMEEMTTIEFELNRSTEAAEKAYYSLYRNTVSVSKSNDPYEANDVIIPGAMGVKKREQTKLPYPRFRNDDDDDDDDKFAGIRHLL